MNVVRLSVLRTGHLNPQKLFLVITFAGGPSSPVGIATGYGLDDPGIESRWERYFPHLSRPALGPTQPPVQWVPGLSRGLRAAGSWVWPFTIFYCRGHERVELYLYSPYGPYGLYRASVPVQGWPLPLPYLISVEGWVDPIMQLEGFMSMESSIDTIGNWPVTFRLDKGCNSG